MSKKTSSEAVNYFHEIDKKLRELETDSLLILLMDNAPGGKEAEKEYSDITQTIETEGIPKGEYGKWEPKVMELMDRSRETGFNVGYALGKFGLDALRGPKV